jgi:UDP-glucose 4-epimerase
VHVWDLANAHVAAMEKFNDIFQPNEFYVVINLGTGNGITVREMVEAFEKVVAKKIPKVDMPVRPGDVAGAYANADKAFKLLAWKAQLPIERGIADSINWSKIRLEKHGY